MGAKLGPLVASHLPGRNANHDAGRGSDVRHLRRASGTCVTVTPVPELGKAKGRTTPEGAAAQHRPLIATARLAEALPR